MTGLVDDGYAGKERCSKIELKTPPKRERKVRLRLDKERIKRY